MSMTRRNQICMTAHNFQVINFHGVAPALRAVLPDKHCEAYRLPFKSILRSLRAGPGLERESGDSHLEETMKNVRGILVLSFMVAPTAAYAQFSPTPEGGLPTKTTSVRLANNANAIVIQPVTPNSRTRIALIATHPEHANNFNYFTANALSRYGYTAMMVNYFGP